MTFANRINLAFRRHFYGHVTERRVKRYVKKRHPNAAPWVDRAWLGINRVQTVAAYPLLCAWIAVSSRLQRRTVLNEEKRIRALATPGTTLYAVPVPRRFQRGDVSQYFHFMFDFLLPLSRVVESLPSGVTVYVPRTGGVAKLLEEVYPRRVVMVDDAPQGAIRVSLHAMAPRVCHLTRRDMAAFLDALVRRTGATCGQRADTVMLIERIMPPEGYGHTGGLRRRIRNHPELERSLAAAVAPTFRFENVVLEEMSLREQIERFDRAAGVVAQHGAALSNLIFVRDGTAVAEIYNNFFFDFFRRLGRLKHARYALWPVISGHPTLDVPAFVQWAGQHPKLRHLFQHR